MRAVVRAYAPAHFAPKPRHGVERLVVKALRERMARIHQVGEVAVVGIRSVCVEHLDRVRMAARRELHHFDVAFVLREVLGPDPRRAEEILIATTLVVRPAEEDGEVELLADLRLRDAVVPVHVVVELLERTLPDAAGVHLHAQDLPVLLRPPRERGEPVQLAVPLARRVERVEEVHDRLEADSPVHAHVDAEADLERREAPAEDRREERGRRRHDVREEPLGVHLAEHPPSEVGKLVGDRDVPVAIAVEERVEEDPVVARPLEVGDHPRADLRGEVWRGAAAEDPRPREEDLADAPEVPRTRIDERRIQKMADGERAQLPLSLFSHHLLYYTQKPLTVSCLR